MMIIPSRGRPHLIKRFIEAYVNTKAMCPVIVRIDNDDPQLAEYFKVFKELLPETWKVECGERMKCPQAFAWLFEAYPDAPWYSLFGDDVVPETPHWDRILIQAAGTKKVAYGDDKFTWPRCPHPIIGGDLVRAVGWLAFPGVLHWYMDTAYEWLANETGRLVPRRDVVTAHYHEDFGGQKDKTYEERWLDTKTNEMRGPGHDELVWQKWHASGEAAITVQRIKELCPL